MRIAIVVQRYGVDIVGGSELEARQLAEHLRPYIQVEVLTTCAHDIVTWQNHYPPGVEIINQIPVRRFPVRAPRDIAHFNALSSVVYTGESNYFEQLAWMQAQGPDAPELFDYIRRNHQRYDLFVFLTYLYATTFTGLQLVPEKSVLIPTAHDEPPIYLDLFRGFFHLPRGILFNAEEERTFVHQQFKNSAIPNAVLGLGIDRPNVPAQAEVNVDDYILYMGRIDPSKGCDELFEYFLEYKERTKDPVKLVLIGTKLMSVPDHADIIPLGFLPGDERFAWLQKASLYVHPSPYESFSLSTLEAMALGVPVLVNGRVPVLKAHVDRSQGGLYYQSKQAFVDSLRHLRTNGTLRADMGRRGKAYVNQWYEWRTITERYVTFLKQIQQSIRQNPPPTP